MRRREPVARKPAARLIDARIRELRDWRGDVLRRVRRLIKEADPGIVEEWKWVKPSSGGVPVWSHNGGVCTGESYKSVVKLTFFKGASLHDPAHLFNSSLGGNVRRAIDIREGDEIDESAFKDLVRAAVELNLSGKTPATRSPTANGTRASATRPAGATKRATRKPALLAGGNPQIPKAEGAAPVRAYIAAMPGWKRGVGKRLDALITRTAPSVRKAVKWNSPFYGIEGRGWFLSFHVFTRYVKVTFFRGSSLRPPPPGGTPRSGETRWVDIHEDGFDEAQLAKWVKRAAPLPGWDPGSKS